MKRIALFLTLALSAFGQDIPLQPLHHTRFTTNGDSITVASAVAVIGTNQLSGLSVAGNTWLNNSNLLVSFFTANSNTIPVMTGYTTPSGTASASSEYDAFNRAWQAFTARSPATNYWSSASTNSAWLQYSFPNPIPASAWASGVITVNSGGQTSLLTFSYSNDGTSWTVLTSTNTPGNPTTMYVPFNTVIGKYFRWTFTNSASVFFNAVELSISTTNLNYINSSPAISVNSPGGTFFNGSVDSTIGFTVNGQALVTTNGIQYGDGSNTNQASPSTGVSVFTQLYVTNCAGIATNFNGIYDQTGTGYYTNETSGWCLVGPSILYGTNVSSWRSYLLITNASLNPRQTLPVPAYGSPFLIGNWLTASYNGSPTNLPTVSIYSTSSSSSGGATTNQIPMALQDTNVANYIATANVTDYDATIRLYGSFDLLKRNVQGVNAYQWLTDARLNQDTYHPQTNLTVFLQPVTTINPVYSQNGFQTYGTNIFSFPLRQPVTSSKHTEVWVLRLNPLKVSYLKTGTTSPMSYSRYFMLGGLQDTNTAAGTFLLNGLNCSFQAAEHTGSATNWSSEFLGSPQYKADFMAWGCDGYSQGRNSLGLHVIVHSVDGVTNKMWDNGTACIANFDQNAKTNVYISPINCTNVLNQFTISNADFNLYPSNRYAQTFQGVSSTLNYGNVAGEEIYAVMSFGTNADQNFADVVTASAMKLLPPPFIVFSGTSMMAPNNTGGDNSGLRIPWDNSIAWNYQQLYPNDTVFEIASTGSALTNGLSSYANYGWFSSNPMNMWADIYATGAWTYLITDEGRNDTTYVSGGGGWVSPWGLFNAMMSSRMAAIHNRMTTAYIGTPMIEPFKSAQIIPFGTSYGANGFIGSAVVYLNPSTYNWVSNSVNDVGWSTNSGATVLSNPTIPITGAQFITLKGLTNVACTAYVFDPLTVSNNVNYDISLANYAHAMKTNPFVSVFCMPIDMLSTNRVGTMTLGGAHLDNTNTGYPFNIEIAKWAKDHAFIFHDPTNSAVTWIPHGNLYPDNFGNVWRQVITNGVQGVIAQ